MLDSRVQCESAACPGTCCWWNMNHVTSGPCSQQPHNLTLHIIAASTWSMMKQAEIELNLYSLEFDLRERLCLLYFSSLMVSDPSAFTSQVLLQDDVGLNFPAAAFVLSAELQQLRRFLQHTALQPQNKIFFFSHWLLCVHWWQWSSWLPVFTGHGSWPGLITLRHTNQIFSAGCWWRTQPCLTCDGESEFSTSLSLSCLVHLLMHAQHCQLLSGKKFSLTVTIQI